MPRIAIARFAHEGNSFSPIQTTLADFRSHEWKIGAEVTPHFRGTNTEIGGAVAFLEAYASWQPTWLRVAAAEPSGPLAPGVFEAILDEILDGLRRHGPWDAVYLAQHGSLNVHDRPHADLDILRAVRGAIGPAPLGATFDLHANMSQEEVDLLDIAVGYKCHPHTDMAAVARKCLDLLLRRAAGDIRPVGVICPINAMLPSIFGRTTDGPMAEVKAIAAEIGRQDGLLDVTPFHGYTYGDSPVAGASA
ncbi:MAG: M81 family metallopeptidase, partial [Alphaproteobacteria bacterium]|nr:M81 family metallopeptidase [Alphaproteobacteria bacterium]